MLKSTILPIFVLVLIVVAIAFAVTGVTVWDFANDCAAQGGTFSIDGPVANCRY